MPLAGIDRDALSGRRVHVKRGRTLDERRALSREITLACVVREPALRRVLAVAREPTELTVVFEWVEGTPLLEHLASHGGDGDEIMRCAVELLRALRALHDAGYAHGDLKPEHVLLDGDGSLRLIDLGLAARLGERASGGTHGYLAPELLAGEPLSPQSDLYALGKTLKQIPELTRAASVATLVEQAISERPGARPSSATAALVALGALGAREPRALEIPAAVRARWQSARGGRVLLLDVPPGGGQTTLAEAILAEQFERERTAIVLEPAGARPLFLAVADLLGIEAAEPEVRAARAAQALSVDERPIVVEGVERLDPDGVASVIAAARAIALGGVGCLVLVGHAPDLERELGPFGVESIPVPPLTVEAISRILAVHGAPHDARTLAAVKERTSGRAGWVSRLASTLGAHPESSVDDAWSSLGPRAHEGDSSGPKDDGDRLKAAETALAEGAPRRALELLARAPETLESLRLSARAEVLRGRLELAEPILRKLTGLEIEPEARLARRLEWARLLERLGRHGEALEEALAVRDEASRTGDRAEALTVAAISTLALGDPQRAGELAAEALAMAPRARARARLHATRSDAALRSGDGALALEHATLAQRAADETADPSARAHALSRLAAAHALSGETGLARGAWQAALAQAEASGDVTALPPYVMNLATADHAAHHVAAAISGYERAAMLARRLGRTGSEVAALTNLGGLFVTLGADVEAAAVLERALEQAERARIPLYAAQAKLFSAESLARRDTARALARAREAERGFVECGAKRQALEATLLAHEIRLLGGEHEHARAFAADARAALAGAGLAVRGLLLEGRAALRAGDLEAARRAADEAVSLALKEGDRDAVAQGKGLLALVHQRLGTGAGEGLAGEAKQVLGELAARVPPGLREAFLGTPERRAITALVTGLSPGRGAEASARGLNDASRRLLALVSRTLLERNEQRVLETALDEAVTATRAERAFLLLRREGRRPEVASARNLDKESIQKSRFRFSRSVAERVLETGEPLLTASATEDPSLMGSRSVLDLGLRSIVVVPVRSRAGLIGALYVDHRFETGRFDDADREILQALADVIGLALENGRLHREAELQRDELARTSEALRAEAEDKDKELHRLTAISRGRTGIGDDSGIVGSAPALSDALELAARVATSDLGVLIEGESGTGKELFARFVHQRSRRKDGPLAALNCGALPESILESELFGHVRGAFTGAIRDHLGTFRAAHGGTLFLDEIGELPPSAQARLLRVLEAREVLPVGATKAIPVDVRVITATNRHLESEVEAGRFRRDLYFRLVGVTITLPPLRERREDVPKIAAALLERIASEPGMRAVSLSPRATQALIAHDWPGNVRELFQSLRRAVAVSDGPELSAVDLGIATLGPDRSRREAHLALDRQMLERALRAAAGNRTRAAESLGVTRVTLHRAIKRLGVTIEAKLGRPKSA